jgi:hypothetical protein
VEGTCRFETGEGCAEDEACHIVGIDPVTLAVTTGCLPSLRRPIGGACSQIAQCESGLACPVVTGTNHPGFCTPLCCGGAGCPAGMECAPFTVTDPEMDAGTPFAHAGLCVRPLRDCDLVRQVGCDPGTACYPSPAPTCLPPGTLPSGSACEAVADCAPGSTCVAYDDGTAFCRARCASDRDCDAGETCEMNPFGFGLCGD